MSQPSVLVAAACTATAPQSVRFNGYQIEELTAGLDALRKRVAALKPAVLLLDIGFPGLDQIDGVRAIQSLSPATRILVLSRTPHASEELNVLKQGAMGYCYSGAKPELLLKAIQKVEQGEIWFERKSIAVLMEELYGAAEKSAGKNEAFRLTAREEDIIRILVTGTSNKEIAAALKVAPATVKTHLTNIFRKTGATDRLRLALLARGSETRTRYEPSRTTT